jgi:hypothetical protein
MSDLAMSTTAPIDGVEVFSLGTRDSAPVTLSNSSSADCPGSGFDVALLANSANGPAPTLQWRVGGGAWQGADLSWDNGSATGDPNCASPCWKTGIIGLDVPAHRTLTIDVAVIFHCAGFSSCGFMGAVDYTDDAVAPGFMPGVTISWSYDDLKSSGSGSGGGSTGSAPVGGAGSSKPPAVSSRPPAPSRSAAPSIKASPRPSPSVAGASPSSDSPAPAPAASADLATVADTRAGGTGMSSLIALIAVVVLALAFGSAFVLIRRRRADQTSDEI